MTERLKRQREGGVFHNYLLKKFLLFLGIISCCIFSFGEANAQSQSEVRLSLSPDAGSFLVGSIFDISIILDTDNTSVNTVKVDLGFPSDMLQIVSPSSGRSFISSWTEQPSYSNTEGTIGFTGGIPEGINTSSGILSTITFRAIKAGEATIRFLPSSSVLANDGKGTEVLSRKIEGSYTLEPKPFQGPKVFSKTHPDETRWYNNNNPIVSWEKEVGVTDFSFVLDNYPQSVPDNAADGQETAKAYEGLEDGLWYFHIKAKKEGVWGSPSHFLLRIDSTPPVSFKPNLEFLLAAIIGRAFVSFSTVDALSGVDHYEVAVIDRTEPPLRSPVFIEAESPYQLPKIISGNLRVLVRATDKSGNARDEQVDGDFPEPILSVIKDKIVFILSGILALIFIYFILNFLFGQKSRFRKNNKDGPLAGPGQ